MCGCRSHQPFRRTHRHGCMAGYHCLMPTAFHPMQHNPHLTSCGISFIATPYPIFRIPRCEIYHQSLFLVAINPQFIGILSKKWGTILDLTYSALKVHQNTGRGEVKRNPCLECANRLVPKTRQNLCHPAGVLLTVS